VRYLYFGLEGLNSPVTVRLDRPGDEPRGRVHAVRAPPARQRLLLNIACVLAFFGIWIEKGMGFVVPGFIPTPLGEVFEYSPTALELILSAGIWATGILVFTLLARASIAISLGEVGAGPAEAPAADAAPAAA
jgi:hypothetical protein